MGTTIVAALFSENHVTLAHVGDSRIYRFRKNQLSQVTNDHSLRQELIDKGYYTPEDARATTPKNLVTRALGIDEQVAVEVTESATEGGDIFLLCSDGLNDMVEDEEISLTLGKYSANLLACAQELVRLANQNGGKDNVSVVLARPRGPNDRSVGLLARLKELLFRAS
jgi:protein phosphatase